MRPIKIIADLKLVLGARDGEKLRKNALKRALAS
jgi:hypothetical protein